MSVERNPTSDSQDEIADLNSLSESELLDSSSVADKMHFIPLEEAARNEVSRRKRDNDDLSPVYVLQVLLFRRGRTPKYELIQTEGPFHEPIFKYTLSISSDMKTYFAIGSGSSKREAKYDAAQRVLDQLIGCQTVNAEVNIEPSKIEPPNPVGKLSEACITRKWPPPVYEFEETLGPPHEKSYTVCAYVNNYKEEGTGTSKKSAKREAAQNMLEFLKTVPFEAKKKIHDENEDDKSDMKLDHGSAFMTPQLMKKISRYHEQSYNKGPELKKLLGMNLDFIEKIQDSVQVLENICAEMKCKISFIDIEEKSKVDMFQCLVTINSDPVSVFCGSGDTPYRAKTLAALRGLSYFHVLLSDKIQRRSAEASIV